MATVVQGDVKRSNALSYIHVLMMFILMFGIGFLPPFGQVTPLGMDVLGVFLGTLYGWITIDVMWPSILGMVVIGMTDATTVTGAFSTGLGNQIVIMTIVAALFAGALDACKITDLMAAWFLTRKCIKGRPWVLVSMILCAAAFIGMFSGGLAGTFVLWAAVLRLADMCGYKKGDRTIAFLICMIVIVSLGSNNSIPFHPGAIAFSGFLMQAVEGTVPYVPFFLFNIIGQGSIYICTVLAAKYILKLDVSKLNVTDEFCQSLGSLKLTRDHKIGLAATVAFFILLFMPGLLPAAVPGMAFLNRLGLIGVTSLILVALCILKREDGQSFLNLQNCHRSIPWPVIWLMAATFPLADAMKSQECGIMATILTAVKPFLAGMGVSMFMLLSILILGLGTQVAHNLVLGAMFIPFLTPICVELGGNPYTFYVMMYMVLQAAFVTPAASANAALMHGHDWVLAKDAYIIGAVFLVLTLVILALIGIPLGNVLFQ